MPRVPHHLRTDPACESHRRPRGPLSRWWFDRRRGIACPLCQSWRRIVADVEAGRW